MAATPAWRSPIPGALASRPAFQSVESAADYSLYSLSHANLREQHAPGGVYLYSLFWKARPVDHDLVRESYPTTAAAFAAVVNVIADAGGRIRISIAVHRLGRRLGRRHRRRRISIAVVVDAALIGAFGAAAMVGAFSTAALASAVSASAFDVAVLAASFVAAAAALADAIGTAALAAAALAASGAAASVAAFDVTIPADSFGATAPDAAVQAAVVATILAAAFGAAASISAVVVASVVAAVVVDARQPPQLRVPVGLATPLDRPLPHGLLPPWGAWRVLRQPFEHDPRLFLT